MSDLENSNQQNVNSGDLQQQVANLRRQTTTLFIALVIVSFVFAAFVGVQALRAGKDADAIRPQATQVVEMNKREKPGIEGFVSQLAAYGQTHPDYAEKILAKYGIRAGAPTAPTAGQPGVIAPIKK